MSTSLHSLVKRGDFSAVRQLLGAPSPDRTPTPGINACDDDGLAPLMLAVQSPRATLAWLRLLLDHGADVNQNSVPGEYGTAENVLSLALRGGDPATARFLLDHGADLHYRREGNYTALVDAVHTRAMPGDGRLLARLQLLVDQGADLNAVTSYGESGCRVLSRLGRFDAVRLLLEAGADPAPLQWSSLPRAVALGSLAEVQAELTHGPALEEKDFWERTPFLLAVQTGDVAKVRLLLAHGADRQARGRCRKPPLFYAIEGHHQPMLAFLLELGFPVEDEDEFGGTPLMDAAEHGNPAAIDALLRAGAEVDAARDHQQTALSDAADRDCALRLLAAGADPQRLSTETKRTLLGFDPDPVADELDAVTPAQYAAAKNRRFGTANPEKTTDPFRSAMIRSGLDADRAARHFGGRGGFREPPVWCARRFGQSITFLPDGRVVQIAGEHEDHYDPDFCIYNDVFVHDPDGTVTIFDYPPDLFPPTDFHTATLLGDGIYIVGSLGYHGERHHGATPVYRLDTRTFRLERIASTGDAPGWIFGHRAVARSAHEIRVTGGKIATPDGTDEIHTDNPQTFVYHVEHGRWTRG